MDGILKHSSIKFWVSTQIVSYTANIRPKLFGYIFVSCWVSCKQIPNFDINWCLHLPFLRRWRHQVPPTAWQISTKLLGTTSQLKAIRKNLPVVTEPEGHYKWSRGLRRGSAAAPLLGLWVLIPPDAWMFVCCDCSVLSEFSATSLSLIQRGSTDCGASLCVI